MRKVLTSFYPQPTWKTHDAREYFGESALIEELHPMYDHHKSFNKRAHIVIHGGIHALYSYNTKVAEFDGQRMVVFGTYSATTLRHIKEFLYQMGFGINNKSDVEKFIGVA